MPMSLHYMAVVRIGRRDGRVPTSGLPLKMHPLIYPVCSLPGSLRSLATSPTHERMP